MLPKFEVWYQDVDKEIQRLAGISRDDLPDQPYRDWYDEGKSAKQAAVRAVARAKKDMGF